MANLGQLRADCLMLLAETSSDTHFTPDSDGDKLRTFINGGVSMTAILSENSRDDVRVTTERGVGAYTLPSDNLLIKSAYFGDPSTANDYKPLRVLTEETLKNIAPYWLDETVDTEGSPRELLVLDKQTIFLYPRPNATYAGKKLGLRYIFNPQPLVAEGDEPNLSLAYHQIIKFYACYLAYVHLKNTEMAKQMKSDWLEHYNLINGTLEKEAQELFRWNWSFTE